MAVVSTAGLTEVAGLVMIFAGLIVLALLTVFAIVYGGYVACCWITDRWRARARRRRNGRRKVGSG